MEDMDVKSTAQPPSGPSWRSDRSAREAARRDGRPLPADDIRARVQQLTIRQQRFDRYLASELGVDAPGLEAMDHLIAAGPATPTELARRLGISTAATTLVLNRLEEAGHIRRDRHPSDGRKLIVTAAQSSADRAYARVLPMIEGVEQLIEGLSAPERATVQKFLDGLVAVYDQATD